MSIPKPELPDAAAAGQRRNPFARAAGTQVDEQEKPPAAPAPQVSGGSAHRGDRPASAARPSREQAKPEPEPVPAETEPQRKKRPNDSRDVLLSLPTDLKQRMESVLAYTYPHTGVQHQQVFIRNAIAAACAELEERYNNGYQWPPLPKSQRK